MTPPIHLILRMKRQLTATAWLFTFEPNQPLSWQAGQFIRVELPHANPDAAGAKRSFTIASAPADRTVEIATRLGPSSFKQALAALPLGGHLNLIDPPAGDFTWPTHRELISRPLVFATQGIGLTPIRSLVRQRLHDRAPIAAHLIASHPAGELPFHDELLNWTRRDPSLRLTITRQPLTATHLHELEPKLPEAVVYLSGPGPLIQLLLPPINLPANRLKHDQFTGYTAARY